MIETSSCTAWPGTELLWEWNKEPELKLSMQIRTSEGTIVVYCKGRIVYRKEVAALSCTLAELLPQTQQLVLEMSEVESMDGAGLGELLSALSCAQARGCRMILAAPSRRVRELLDVTRLASVFEIRDTAEDVVPAAHSQAAAAI